MMAENSITLSLAAVDILSEALGTNARLFPFQIPSLGELVEDRMRIGEAVVRDLERRGLARRGNLVPDVERALRLLSEYQVSIAVLGTVEQNRTVYARAFADGRAAVLVLKQDQTMRFDLIRPEALVRATVNLLPALAPGPGQSSTITQPAGAEERRRPAEANEPHRMFNEVRPQRTSADSQRRAAESILRRPRTGTGYFIVSGRGRQGNEREAPGLSWIDTDSGRYLVQVRDGKDGQTFGTFAPADNARLQRQLGELVQLVR
ncbi:MAG: ESX secretion-associated protein EspG [Sciscionella sp.]